MAEDTETEQYLQFGTELKDNMAKLALEDESSGWQTIKEDAGLIISRKMVDQSGIYVFRGQATVDAPTAIVFGLAADITRRKEFNPHCIAFEKIREYSKDPNNEVYLAYYASDSMISMVAKRDFALLRVVAKDVDGKGTCLSAGTSVNHALIPEKDGFIRAVSGISGWVFEPKGEHKCAITVLIQVNPNGWIPSWVVNYGGPNKALEGFLRFQEVVLKDKEKAMAANK